jgi:hypothetical protein
MTTKSRAADEPDQPADEETPQASQGVTEEPPSAGGAIADTSEPLNPTGQPNEELPNAEPDASVEAVNEAGGEQVQAVFEEANAKGYFGETPEQDRDAYTVQGQARNNQ